MALWIKFITTTRSGASRLPGVTSLNWSQLTDPLLREAASVTKYRANRDQQRYMLQHHCGSYHLPCRGFSIRWKACRVLLALLYATFLPLTRTILPQQSVPTYKIGRPLIERESRAKARETRGILTEDTSLCRKLTARAALVSF